MRRAVVTALLAAGFSGMVSAQPRSLAADAGTSWRAPVGVDAGSEASDTPDAETGDGLLPGDTLPPRYRGREYEIADYGARGLAPPPSGARWVRGDDDALLVDRDGRVLAIGGGAVFDGATYDRLADRRGYNVDGDFYPEDRDRAYPERLARNGAGALPYDRDYPFEYRYGGGVTSPDVSRTVEYDDFDMAEDAEAFADPRYDGYTVTETIVTVTTPDTVRRARPGEAVGPNGYVRPRARRR